MKSKMEFVDEARALDPKLTERNAEHMFHHYWKRNIKSIRKEQRKAYSNQSGKKVAALPPQRTYSRN